MLDKDGVAGTEFRGIYKPRRLRRTRFNGKETVIVIRQ